MVGMIIIGLAIFFVPWFIFNVILGGNKPKNASSIDPANPYQLYGMKEPKPLTDLEEQHFINNVIETYPNYDSKYKKGTEYIESIHTLKTWMDIHKGYMIISQTQVGGDEDFVSIVRAKDNKTVCRGVFRLINGTYSFSKALN